jgi:hypothetical protein
MFSLKSSLWWYPEVVSLIKYESLEIMVRKPSAMQYAAIDKHPMTM